MWRDTWGTMAGDTLGTIVGDTWGTMVCRQAAAVPFMGGGGLLVLALLLFATSYWLGSNGRGRWGLLGLFRVVLVSTAVFAGCSDDTRGANTVGDVSNLPDPGVGDADSDHGDTGADTGVIRVDAGPSDSGVGADASEQADAGGTSMDSGGSGGDGGSASRCGFDISGGSEAGTENIRVERGPPQLVYTAQTGSGQGFDVLLLKIRYTAGGLPLPGTIDLSTVNNANCNYCVLVGTRCSGTDLSADCSQVFAASSGILEITQNADDIRPGPFAANLSDVVLDEATPNATVESWTTVVNGATRCLDYAVNITTVQL